MKYVCRTPGSISRKIIARDHRVVSHCLTREYSFVFKKAKGCYVWDVDGWKYLDFSAGVAVANIGHTNPTVTKAITSQSKEAIHSAFGDFYAELPVEFIELLLTFVPRSLNNAFLSNSGTESVEAAYKLARWHSKKKWVLAFEGSFHGRTMGSLSLTKSKPVHRQRYSPFLPVKHVPFPYAYRMNMGEECGDYCLNEVEKAIKGLKEEVAAVFVEPIQGEGGYIVPPKDFHKGLRKICTEYGVLLCDDEVQAGCFRTGDFLALEGFGVTPDVVSLSKAIGGGIPLGATLANRKLNDWPPGAHACFHRRAKVILADGSKKEISDIVNKKMKLNVLSYNYKTGLTEQKRIVNWFKKRLNSNHEWYKVITTKSINEKQAPNVTKEHKYYVVDKGWVKVKDLRKGDKILLPIPEPTQAQEQIIIGSIFGDGGLSKPKAPNQNAKNPHLTLGHKKSQLEYLKFKFEVLKNLTSNELTLAKNGYIDEKGYRREPFYYFRTINHQYFKKLRDYVYIENGKNKVTKDLLNRLQPLGLAIWYMDDGSLNKWRVSLSTVNFDEESVNQIISHLKNKYNLLWKKEPIRLKSGEVRFRINLYKEGGSERFMKLISPWITDCMKYKLRPEIRKTKKLWKNIKLDVTRTKFKPAIGEVIKVIKSNISMKRTREHYIYDIEVEDNHNYFIPTALVSNSTFGGNLLACAAGKATLKFMKKMRVGEKAKKTGKFMMKILEEMRERYEIIGDVRGRGLMIGVEFVKDKKSKKYGIEERHQVLCRSSEKGLLLLPAGKSVIRICPPLILTKEQAETGLDILEDAIKMVK